MLLHESLGQLYRDLNLQCSNRLSKKNQITVIETRAGVLTGRFREEVNSANEEHWEINWAKGLDLRFRFFRV
jgi:hypothetical protein